MWSLSLWFCGHVVWLYILQENGRKFNYFQNYIYHAHSDLDKWWTSEMYA
ncbi:hypothetical protein AMTRI_Chr10g7120 [Amborella trichopoda]